MTKLYRELHHIPRNLPGNFFRGSPGFDCGESQKPQPHWDFLISPPLFLGLLVTSGFFRDLNRPWDFPDIHLRQLPEKPTPHWDFLVFGVRITGTSSYIRLF